MTKILITGKNGMLASDFQRYYTSWEIFACDKEECNITDRKSILRAIEKYNPDVIINCAAYTNVEQAEDIGKISNYEINTFWVYELAKISFEKHIDFITFSTDYVFDGEKEKWYDENDICNPLNQYAMSKYLWERLALKENPNTIIIRTSWLYGGGKEYKNFVNTIAQKLLQGAELNIVSDQYGFPTYTKDLVQAVEKCMKLRENYIWKILHLSNSGDKPVSWFEFAQKISVFLWWGQWNIKPCRSQDYSTKAKRPLHSILKNSSEIFLPNWEESLKEYIDNYYKNGNN